MKFIKFSWNVPRSDWLKWKVTDPGIWGRVLRFLVKHSIVYITAHTGELLAV